MKKLFITFIALIFIQLGAYAQRVNVAFTIDNNYPIFTLLAINSILVNNASNSDYTFYIIENNVTARNKKFMRNFVEDKKQKIEFINIDTSIIDNGKYFYTFSDGQRITPIGMARIMIPELLPNDVDRVIYIDGDTLITADLKELYNEDLGSKYIGMSKNFGNLEYKMYKFSTYCNSGVILMDLNKLREHNISKKMVTYLNVHSKEFIYSGETDNSVYLYPDQDLINVVLDKNIKLLDQRWNNQTIRRVALSDFNQPGIIHYIGPNKPWDFPKYYTYGVKMYYQYWKASSLKKYLYLHKFKSVKREYIDLCRKKYSRYKMVLKSMKQGKFTFLY